MRTRSALATLNSRPTIRLSLASAAIAASLTFAPNLRAQSDVLPQVNACDLTGNWRNTTDGARFQIAQSGAMMNFQYHNQSVMHWGSGAFNPEDNSFLIRQNRKVKDTGCVTQGNMTFKLTDCNTAIMTATWDGGCGTPASEGPYMCVRE